MSTRPFTQKMMRYSPSDEANCVHWKGIDHRQSQTGRGNVAGGCGVIRAISHASSTVFATAIWMGPAGTHFGMPAVAVPPLRSRVSAHAIEPKQSAVTIP